MITWVPSAGGGKFIFQNEMPGAEISSGDDLIMRPDRGVTWIDDSLQALLLNPV
ncbi:hypothetical protein KP190050_20530 [Klebsiella pneumoniae subsp. pneumoniae]